MLYDVDIEASACVLSSRYAMLCYAVHLKLLFQMMLLHGYVPNSFGLGIIVPLVKDKSYIY